MTFVPEDGRIPAVHHPSALRPDGRTRLMKHCEACGVRTYCRVSNGVLLCADRCWPLVSQDHTGKLIDGEPLA